MDGCDRKHQCSRDAGRVDKSRADSYLRTLYVDRNVSTTIASALNTAINGGCSLATSTVASSTVTITASTGGYAGDFTTQFTNNGTLFQAGYVTITNTVLGQGPNYVSGITIGTQGSGYQPETPITLTGGGGTRAIAVANTTPATASQSYQPAYGAAPGYDLATGLGTPNAYNLVYSSVWGPVQQPCPVTFPNPGPLTYGATPATLGGTDTCSLPITYTVNSGPGTVNGSTLTITGAGTINITASQPGSADYLPASTTINIVVNQATLTVTADPASMTYGDSLPTFTASYNGFVNGDGQGVLSGSPSLTTTATSTSPVGNYTITAAQGTLLAANYTFTFVNGTLTINQRNASVTPNAASKTYGDSDPTFTGTLTASCPLIMSPRLTRVMRVRTLATTPSAQRWLLRACWATTTSPTTPPTSPSTSERLGHS